MDPAEAARVGATARELIKVLVREAVALAAVGQARRERIRERAFKLPRRGREPVAWHHRELMWAPGRPVRRGAEPSKAEPLKWASAQLVRAPLAPESKAVHGTLWEGAVVARHSIQTRVVSGLRAKAELPVVLAARAAARAVELG